MGFTFWHNDALISEAYRRVLMRDLCVYCAEEPTGLDHIVPRATYAGERSWCHGWENRAPACARCDYAKGSEPLLVFLARVRRRPLAQLTGRPAARLERMRDVQRKLRRERV